MLAPIIWRRLGYGIKIQELTDDYFEKILFLTQDYFLKQDFLCRDIGLLDEKESVESFLTQLYHNLWDYKSIIALDERNKNCIAGFLVLRSINNKDYASSISNTNLVKGEKYKQITQIMNSLQKCLDVFEIFDCENVLRYYLMCVLPEYKNYGLETALFQVGIDVARTYKIPVIMGFFNDYMLQSLAGKVNMTALRELPYANFEDNLIKDRSKLKSNYSFMAGKVIPEPIPDPLPKPEEKKGKKGKKGKKDKKKKTAKK